MPRKPTPTGFEPSTAPGQPDPSPPGEPQEKQSQPQPGNAPQAEGGGATNGAGSQPAETEQGPPEAPTAGRVDGQSEAADRVDRAESEPGAEGRGVDGGDKTARHQRGEAATRPRSPGQRPWGDGGRPVVGIVMGSSSDLVTMQAAVSELTRLGVDCEVGVRSAHRDPFGMLEYGRTAAARGLKVLIAGAGGAAHLPGMLASVTTLPVIGVPVPLKVLDGLDSLLSIVQMPAGVPVATVGVGNAANAGLLAARILATADADLSHRLSTHQDGLRDKARAMDAQIPRLLGGTGE